MTAAHRFGPFTLDIPNRQLMRNGEELPLRARAFDVLVTLVERAGNLVTKDELLDTVWSELAVEENNLQVQVSTLRKWLGPGWIVTVPGRGYRFAGELAGAKPEHRRDATAGRAHADVPHPVTPLIGRAEDLAALAAAVATTRCVTVTGPGGVGKTRLAQELALATSGEFADGCRWLDMAAIADPLLAVEGVAASLGAGGSGDPAAALIELLHARSMLLAFDNAEHVVEALAPLVARILVQAPGLRILTTSQRPLGLPGEHLHRLAPLAVPESEASPEEARGSPAVELFLALARAQVGDLALDARTTPWVIDVCRQLDGVPLALELAAGRLPGLGLEELSKRLEQRFRLLRAARRGVPARQQDLESLIDWSYRALEPDEQTVYRRLCLLPSSFTLADAVAVARDQTLDEWAVIAVVGDLVDRSLVLASGDDPPEYTLLETGRAFARARLGPGDTPFVERAIGLLEERGVAAAAQSSNREALRACAAALELVPLLPPGPARDNRELDLDLAVGPVFQTTLGPAHARAESLYRRACELAAGLPAGERGFMARWGWWHSLSMRGHDREAATVADELLALAGELGDPALELEAFHARMTTQQLLGRVDAVTESAARVLALYEPGRHQELGARFGGHDPGICALGHGAVAEWLAGRIDEATARAQRAIDLGASRADAYSRGVGLFYASFVWAGLGEESRLRAATDMLTELCARHAMDMLSNEALFLASRARLATGEIESAIAGMGRALDTIDAGGDYAFAPFYASILVETLLDAGRLEEARTRLARAPLYAGEGQGFFAPELTRLEGELDARTGNRARASIRFRDALEWAERQGATWLALRAATSAVEQGDGECEPLARILDRIRGGTDSPVIRKARRALENRR